VIRETILTLLADAEQRCAVGDIRIHEQMAFIAKLAQAGCQVVHAKATLRMLNQLQQDVVARRRSLLDALYESFETTEPMQRSTSHAPLRPQWACIALQRAHALQSVAIRCTAQLSSLDKPCKRLQCDEIWSLVYAKAKNVATAKAAPEGAGDAWTWTAIDADTKLVAAWRVGTRASGVAYDFMQAHDGRSEGLSGSVRGRVRLKHRLRAARENLRFASDKGAGAQVQPGELLRDQGNEGGGRSRWPAHQHELRQRQNLRSAAQVELVASMEAIEHC
jgi:hypothetical protein